MKSALLVGAGVAGCSAALEFARSGWTATLLESSNRPGGNVLSYCCKATDSCSRCGVCVAHATVAEAVRHPRVRVLAGATLVAVERPIYHQPSSSSRKWTVRATVRQPAIDLRQCIDCGKCVEACPQRCIGRSSRGGLTQYAVDHPACLVHLGKACDACAKACPVDAVSCGATERRVSVAADAVLVASGHQAFDPSVKPRLGYRRLPGVMTGLEAEQELARGGGLGGGSVAFVQCVGSRDPSVGRNFCSSVCCAYALRMARVLRSREPGTEVVVYAIDVQHFDKTQRAFRESVEAAGVRIVRGVPSQVSRGSDGRLHLSIEDPATAATTAVHDVVVLSTGMQAAPGADRVAELFGLERDAFGFLRSASAGLAVAGTAARPQALPDAMADGRTAALALAEAVP